MPYVFGSLKSVEDNVLPLGRFLKPLGVEIPTDEVTEIIPKEKLLRTRSGKEIGWDQARHSDRLTTS